MHRFWTNRGSSTEFSQMCFVKKYHLLQIFTRNMQADPHSIPSIWRAKIRRGKGYRFYQPDILQLNGENSGIICSYFSLLTYPNLAVLKDVSYKTRSVSYNYQQSFRTKKDVSYNLYETSWSHSYKKKLVRNVFFCTKRTCTKRLWYETSRNRATCYAWCGVADANAPRLQCNLTPTIIRLHKHIFMLCNTSLIYLSLIK